MATFEYFDTEVAEDLLRQNEEPCNHTSEGEGSYSLRAGVGASLMPLKVGNKIQVHLSSFVPMCSATVHTYVVHTCEFPL